VSRRHRQGGLARDWHYRAMAQNQRPALVVADWPPVFGRPGLAQGRYGAAGNLELVIPAVDDGLWVAWFNNDPIESHIGAAVGRWSGVLRFATGHRYVSAKVTQVDSGPDFLEVVALTVDGQLRRHVWSPAAGFVDWGIVQTEVLASSSILQGDGSLQLVVVHRDGKVLLLRANPDQNYPFLSFRETRSGHGGVSDVDAAWHIDHVDTVFAREGRAVLDCPLSTPREADLGPAVGVSMMIGSDGVRRVVTCDANGFAILRFGDWDPVDLGPVSDVAVTAVNRNGNMQTDVLLRNGEILYHQCIRPHLLRIVRAEVWTSTPQISVHRG
jgi:hypothetical protein